MAVSRRSGKPQSRRQIASVARMQQPLQSLHAAHKFNHVRLQIGTPSPLQLHLLAL
ncbi:hypothetical protein BIWAKO_00888 [Bosea sp. BIWAKO-01]|nr:hypothetical protein BIWAKO_00888 [Bosea sp. BIWAKO-01]